MTRHRLAIGAVALGFTLSAVPAGAGQRPGGEGGGPGGGGGASSDSRPGGGGGTAGVGSGGGGSAGNVGSGSSSSSGSSSGGGSSFAPAPSRPEAASERAPQHPRAQPRGGGERRGGGDRPRSGEATGRAVPRGTTPSSGDATTSSSSGDRDRDRAAPSPRDRAVPAYSRPRDGRPVTGRAGERVTPLPDRRGRDGYYYSPYPYGYYHDPYGYYGSYWYPGYAFGLGYFYYDPFWYGNYGSYGMQGYGGYGGSGSGRYGYGEAGSLRLKIKPRDAQVYVDGYFVGTVDSFDGVFQRLSVEAGGHKIEIRAPGYETLQFDVLITPGETVTYKGDMPRIQ